MAEGNVVDYAVIGGGIAGLYCCYHLKKHPEGKGKKIALYEASDRLGGRIQTWRINPAAFRTPPLGDTSANHPTISELLREDERLKLLNAKLLKQEEDLRKWQPPEPLPEIDKFHDHATVYPEQLRDMFVAEFGPMRIEPDHQPYLRELLDNLKIKEPSPRPGAQPKWSDLIPFPAYRGTPPTEPLFNLEGEEGQQTELIDLLLLALRRVFEVLEIDKAKDQDRPWGKNNYALDEFWWSVRQESFLYRRFWKRWLRQWINLADDAQYKTIRERAIFRDTPLRDMGFWNLLSTVMSHMAIVKIRDWGSFYHLLPENPSAAEWVIFWLRAIKSTDSLRGIRGGMDWIVHRLCGKLGFKISEDEIYEDEKISAEGDGKKSRLYPLYKACDGAQVQLFLRKKLVNVEQQRDNVSLLFASDSEPVLATHVILALPKGPLQNIQFVSDRDVFRTLKVAFDSVVGFPLLKTFFIVKNPFWEDDRPVNKYAYTVPTRELHYSKSRDKTMGMMMLYTDRPGTQFWSDFLVEDLKKNKDPPKAKHKSPLRELPYALTWTWKNSPKAGVQKFGNDRLLKTFLLYAKEDGAESITAERLVAAGIQDWGLEPYEGAAHVWRPGSEPIKIIDDLAAFSLQSSGEKKLHICGEAYSDYQGFIEGALSSAAKTLKKLGVIAPKNETKASMRTAHVRPKKRKNGTGGSTAK